MSEGTKELAAEGTMELAAEGTKELAATFHNERDKVPTKPGDWNTFFGTHCGEGNCVHPLHLLLCGTEACLIP